MSETAKQPQTKLQQQILQMAQELAANLEHAADNAPTGSVLDACESLLLDQGRQFLRDSLAATLQNQADNLQKKGAPPVPVLAATPVATKARLPANS